jgi:hypothetical protein
MRRAGVRESLVQFSQTNGCRLSASDGDTRMWILGRRDYQVVASAQLRW